MKQKAELSTEINCFDDFFNMENKHNKNEKNKKKKQRKSMDFSFKNGMST